MVYQISDIEPDQGDIHTGTRQCRTCLVRHPMGSFYLTVSGKHRRHKCKGCVEIERKSRVDQVLSDPESAAKYKAMRRWTRIKTRYGLTQTDFQAMMLNQNDQCVICTVSFDEQPPHIDHCHKTGKIRGLLCSQCNRGIGQLRDDPEVLLAAAAYLSQIT